MMTVKDFVEAYGISKHTIYAHARYGNPCIKKIDKHTYIDNDCRTKRKQFLEYVYNKSSDNYFELTKEYTESELSKILSSITGTKPRVWYNLFKNSLFTLGKSDMGPFVYKPADRVYRFLLLTNYILDNNIDLSQYNIKGDVNAA